MMNVDGGRFEWQFELSCGGFFCPPESPSRPSGDECFQMNKELHANFEVQKGKVLYPLPLLLFLAVSPPFCSFKSHTL